MRRNSGLIGASKSISQNSASGIHDTFDVFVARRDSTWPVVKFVSSITTSATTYNEGDSITFTVSTLGYNNGETLYYTITAATGTINTSDFTDSLISGSFSITSNSASIVKTLVLDSTSETNDSFVFEVRSESVSGPILLSSSTISITNPTVSITPSTSSLNEGSSVTFTVNTTNISNQTLYYSITGTNITTGDFSPANLTGSFALTSNSGSFAVTLANDLLTEGTESFTASVRSVSTSGNVLVTSSSVSISDTSINLTATVTPDVSTVNEGSSVTFTVTLNQSASGTYFFSTNTGTGVVAGDFSDGSLTGSFTVTGTSGSFIRTLVSDLSTEGSETFTISVRSGSVSGTILGTSSTITISDTSVLPVATVTPDFSTINEGGTVTFNVSLDQPYSGTYYWTFISDIFGNLIAEDFSDNNLNGSFTITSGSGSVSRTIKEDLLTEGSESFQLQIRINSTSGTVIGTSSNVTVSDTSITPSATVTPDVSSVNEGGSVVFTISTTGYTSGTLYWELLPGLGSIQASDFTTPLFGTVTITGSSGTVTTTLANDLNTEISETYQLRVRLTSETGTVIGTSSTVTINDTSIGGTEVSSGWTANIITQTATSQASQSPHLLNIYFRRTIFVVTYSSSEVAAALGKNSATITGLRFTPTTAPINQPLPNYAIGMKMTTNSITTNNSGGTGGVFTTVRSQASESFTAGVVKEFVFTTNFNWTIGNNLVIAVAWGQCPTTWNDSGFAPIGSGTSYYTWVDDAGTYLVTDSAGTQVSYRPIIQLLG